MTITRTNPAAAGSHEDLAPHRKRPGRRTVLAIGIVALVLAGIAGWLLLQSDSKSSAAITSSTAEPFSPYNEGGSVYNEQVPTQAGANPYAVGGSVYNEQVPAQADSAAANPYAEGGSVYDEQVPSTAAQ
jgi:hypothetical protein